MCSVSSRLRQHVSSMRDWKIILQDDINGTVACVASYFGCAGVLLLRTTPVNTCVGAALVNVRQLQAGAQRGRRHSSPPEVVMNDMSSSGQQHLSLSKTVVLRAHQIEPFVQGLKEAVQPLRRCAYDISRCGTLMMLLSASRHVLRCWWMGESTTVFCFVFSLRSTSI